MISLNTTQIVNAEEQPTKTYCLDLDTGHIKGYVDGLDAIKQFIRKTLISPRFNCLIYGSNYGSEIEAAMVANHWDRNAAKNMLPQLIKDALLVDTRITDVYDFDFENGEGDCLYIKFAVDSVFGTAKVEEAVNIV